MTDDDQPVDDATVSWAELLAEATARLARSGSDNPQIDARRIVTSRSR